jgi:hypothetical protein
MLFDFSWNREGAENGHNIGYPQRPQREQYNYITLPTSHPNMHKSSQIVTTIAP